MKKLIRLGLLLVFLNGFIYDVFTTEKTFIFYGYLFINVGILIEFGLSKILKEILLFRMQLGMLFTTLSLIIGIYIYGSITSVDTFGLGIIISLLFTLLLSQVIVFGMHLLIKRLRESEKWDSNEGLFIYIYTVLFFLLHQVKVPNNYEIPIISYVLSFVFISILFGVIFIITSKLMKKSTDTVLLVALFCLAVLQFAGLDLNIFFLLPTQIVTLLLLFVHLELYLFLFKTD